MQNHIGQQRKLGSTGLFCSPLGFGCYRINRGSKLHEASLRAYLDRGGNLIDTSANYTDGISELLVGEVLRDYPRDRVIVVTKGGYIQGQNMQLARKHDFPEVVHYGEGIWHCIHPEFLQTQVQRSLERMKLDKIDVYLLHNPEYFLTEKQHHGMPSNSDHEEFYRRVHEAFGFLETQVDMGIIGWYGVSSNNYGLPLSDPTMTSVSRCFEVARSVRRDHHFRVVQLPMNLYEYGGALESNNHGQTVLELCSKENLGVLINRPLNAFTGHRMVRLADFVKSGEAACTPETLSSILKPLREHEQRLGVELQAPLAAGSGIAALMEGLVPQLQSSAHWEQVASSHVLQPLQSWLQASQQCYSHDMRWRAWVEDLIQIINPLFEEISRYLSAREQATSDSVRAGLFRAGYPKTEESLSRMALNVLVNLPGLSCVLNGMRRPEYVEDAMGVPSLPPVDGLRILQDFSQLKLPL